MAQKAHSRYLVLFAGSITGCFTGAIYMWSIFNEPLMQAYAWPLPLVSFAYSLFIIVDCIGCLAGGALQRRMSVPRLLTMAGVLFGVGWFLTGFARTIPQLYLTFCIVAGFGDGIVYNVAVSTACTWFPDKRGWANGVCLGCVGLSPLAFAPLGNFLIETFGLSGAFHVFGVFSLVVFLAFSHLVVAPPAGWVPEGDDASASEAAAAAGAHADAADAAVGAPASPAPAAASAASAAAMPAVAPDGDSSPQRPPAVASPTSASPAPAPASAAPAARDYTLGEVVRLPVSWLMMLCFAAMTSAGMMVTAHASDIGQLLVGMDAGQGALMVGLLAVGSCAGRLAFGSLADRIGCFNVLTLAMALTAASMALFGQATTFPLFILALCLVGACFGGCMAVMPVLCAECFGGANVSRNYSFFYVGYTLACFVGPMIAAGAVSATGGYGLAFLCGALLALSACGMLAALRRMTARLQGPGVRP